MNTELKKKLDYHYERYKTEPLSPDPLEIPHLFTSPLDIEFTAFISAIFAYGSVTQILKTLYSILEILGKNPHEKLMNDKKLLRQLKNSKISYRFYSNDDVVNLFKIIRKAYAKHGSLKNLFVKNYSCKHENLKNEIETFSLWFLKECEKARCLSRGFKFMFPLPSKGSAVKRMNLFLRWMVRKDNFDFGLWSKIKRNQLLIPVDTHIARISRELGLTSRKNADWKMAEEITENLKKFDFDDPVKYDFALCHIGIRKEYFD